MLKEKLNKLFIGATSLVTTLILLPPILLFELYEEYKFNKLKQGQLYKMVAYPDKSSYVYFYKLNSNNKLIYDYYSAQEKNPYVVLYLNTEYHYENGTKYHKILYKKQIFYVETYRVDFIAI